MSSVITHRRLKILYYRNFSTLSDEIRIVTDCDTGDTLDDVWGSTENRCSSRTKGSFFEPFPNSKVVTGGKFIIRVG